MSASEGRNSVLRVANVIEDSRLAGPQLRILAVAGRLKEVGVATAVVHPLLESQDFSARLAAAGVESVPLQLARPHAGMKGLARYALSLLADTYRLYKEFRRSAYDLVHCSGGAWQFKGAVAGRLAGIPVIWHLNDTSMPWWVRLVFRIIARWAATAFIVTGARVQSYYELSRWSRKEVFDIQAPVDTAIFDPKEIAEDAEIAALPGTRIVVVGNINPGKGIHLVIEAAKLLKARYEGFAIAIVGPIYNSQRSYYASLQELAERSGTSDIIHFVGPKSDVPSTLAAADIFVCASLYEAGPMVVWEAMAMARPIVSTDVGEVARYVAEGLSGIVVKPGSATALANGISRFLDNPDLRLSCGLEARRVAVRELDISRCASRHFECYTRVAASSRIGGKQLAGDARGCLP